jgi:hypothetical protein
MANFYKKIVILGTASHGLHRRQWAVRGRPAQGRALTGPWAMTPTACTMKIEREVVYNPTIHHGYLLEKNRHPGRRQPWPLPPPIGPPRPFRSKACVDRAMGNAPYHRRHENLAGVDVLPNNPSWQFFTKKSSSWAPPAMVSTATYGPSAAVRLKGAR